MSDAPEFPILLDHSSILTRIDALARAIDGDRRSLDRRSLDRRSVDRRSVDRRGVDRRAGERPLLVACVVEGARTFCRQLTRRLAQPVEIRDVGASSYGDGTVSRGVVELSGGDFDVAGRNVLIVEDIVDTGRTVHRLCEHFTARGAAAVRVATLLSKPARRVVEVPLHYVGFEIDDHFVIGFGMDVAGRYRELPHVALYDAQLERATRTGS
ncbi:MAG: hypoxanthine phosphoribosyltransferase [Planctomycetes bacterium]|nr:hypoxanthine phosphoribosyltransferase [Planctomycetota bacterium]